MIKRALIAAIAMTLTATTVHAGENKLTKPEGAGMLTGAAAGALIGGPVGAFVGLMIGGIIGDGVDQVQSAELRAQAVEDELLETRRELAMASRQANEKALAKLDQEPENEVMLADLAERLRADVLFRTNSTSLETPAQSQLEQIGKLLASHPNLVIHVHGFADPRGTPEQNLVLSHERADTVREALLVGGAWPEQIKTSAHGEDSAIAAKGDVEAYAWERRVSLTIQARTPSQVAQSH